MENYDAAVARGNELAKMQDLSQSKKNYMNYVVGMSLFKKGDYSGALPKLQECIRKERSEIGAEAAYYVVLANYKLANLNDAEESVFYISDNFSNYSYYVAMSFVTLSDVYVAKGNVFQAKATLQSIVENYPGGEPKTLAEQKLAAIENEESKNEEDAE